MVTSTFCVEKSGGCDNFFYQDSVHIILINFDDVVHKKTKFWDKYTKTSCSFSDLPTVQYLVEDLGMDVYAKGYLNKNAYESAVEWSKRLEVIEYLKKQV